MKRRSKDTYKIDTGKWLLTYSDMMNNLLVLFIALYAMSVLDLEKFKAVMTSFSATFGTGSGTSTVVTGSGDPGDPGYPSYTTITESSTTPNEPPEETEPPEGSEEDNEFDELYEKIRHILVAKGYDDDVGVEKLDGYIYFRFIEGVFFYPDLPILKENSYPVIETVGEILFESYDLISTIEISGHTAKLSPDPFSTTNFFAWELSADRALTVLKFLAQKCNLPQEKLSITGFACTRPFAEGYNEEAWAQNRRVEIRISRKTN